MADKITKEKFLLLCKVNPEAVWKLFNKLQKRIDYLEQRVMQLEQQKAKDSRNSSKPPSSDPNRPHPKSLRTKSSRQNGGQKGHKGHTLQKVSNPDHVVNHPLKGDCSCGRNLNRAKHLGCETRQVMDLPPTTIEVTEHQAETKECQCGRCHTAEFPEGVTAPVQYSERIRAMLVYLNSYQLLSQKRTTETMSDLFGVNLSQGTLNNIVMEAYEGLAKTEESIKAAILSAPVIHADETGMYVSGKRMWEHVCSTELFTYYYCNPFRGGRALKEGGVFPNFFGRVVHDGWKSYFDFEVLHGLCNAHHLRELVFVKEQLNQKWAGTLIKHLCWIKRKVDLAQAAKREQLSPITLSRYRRRYEQIIACGYRANPKVKVKRRKGQRGRIKQPFARNLLGRLDKYADEVLAFMYDFNVPFDNNISERDLRMTKVKQKISGCFRSISGAHAFCRIRGYISTVRKHGLNVFEHLVKSLDKSSGQVVFVPE